jgi:hypothetical protein
VRAFGQVVRVHGIPPIFKNEDGGWEINDGKGRRAT